MEKKEGSTVPRSEQLLEECEIIETAIDQIDLLTRAFELIKAACEEPNHEWIDTRAMVPEYLIN